MILWIPFFLYSLSSNFFALETKSTIPYVKIRPKPGGFGDWMLGSKGLTTTSVFKGTDSRLWMESESTLVAPLDHCVWREHPRRPYLTKWIHDLLVLRILRPESGHVVVSLRSVTERGGGTRSPSSTPFTVWHLNSSLSGSRLLFTTRRLKSCSSRLWLSIVKKLVNLTSLESWFTKCM